MGGPHARIADLGLRRVRRQWLSVGQADQAARLTREAIAAGCANPDVIEAPVADMARPGTPEALATAIAASDAALERRDGNTDEAWRLPDARRTQLRSQAARFRVRYKDRLDADGNLVPKRRHHPVVPLRRAPRFHPAVAA